MTTVVNVEDWNFKKSNTRYSTHGSHTWIAAMIPALACKLIKKTKPTHLLDPFCGGGTVCVEAVLNNISTVGVDVNPLSTIVAQTKTTLVDKLSVEEILSNTLKEAKKSKKRKLYYPDHEKYLVSYWFKTEHLKFLDSIARTITTIQDQKLKTFFQCVFSATIRDVSLTYRNEIRLRKLEPQDLAKFDRDVLETFSRRTLDTLSRIQSLPKKINAKFMIGDVKKLPFKNNEFSTIICSPPYGDERNGVPYFQFVKNMLYWLGISKKDLEEHKTNVLGWYNKEIIKQKICPDSKTLQSFLKDISNNSKNIDEATSFYSDYNKGLNEMARVVSDKIVIVIGNRILNKKIINNATITTELFENNGVKLIEHYKRDLPTKRIPRFGDTKKVEGGHIDKEDILIYSVK